VSVQTLRFYVSML